MVIARTWSPNGRVFKQGSTVWVLAHADIVPPGNLSLWESAPYQIKVDGDRIIGRGVEDNQHGFVSAYLALKAIKDSGASLKRSVGLIVVADEETGEPRTGFATC